MWFLLFSGIVSIIAAQDSEHLKEMRFKLWLQPDTEECYHELIDNGTSIYFIYEILNAQTHDSSIIAFFRNATNGDVVAVSTAPQRGHLQLIANATSVIDICMTHTKSDNSAKYISVFLHVYHIEKIAASMKDKEDFDNSSIIAHNSIDFISYHIRVIREKQMELQMINQKDSYLLEQNILWVNRWAILHISLIISCSVFQTFFIRRLFQTPITTKRVKK
ncbi:unnamed protein product [Rotaria sordida]|uniref:GOLD domain-containing protein n=1 Tax=Rotaria sordida TaxID=392033 RepID=A0A814GI41_9BILA|nr:unnamed protein product [Rotaria sordida]CAF0996650.1 unnamed protein product [Rotaria sordida]CAF1073451.1 unnamed protein product [Rotaria sordida]CAF1078353.1 unnamed protein product [Rotaria sordida]CAF3695256.1 unnamed protein product [Rotaria sordida]